MNNEQIITKAQQSIIDAESIVAKMNEIIALANEQPVPPVIVVPPTIPAPTPEPLPTGSLVGVVDITSFGIKPIDSQIWGYTFGDTLSSRITVTTAENMTYYVMYFPNTGAIQYNNILTNGQPTTFQVDKAGVYILKVNNKSYIFEPASSVITAEILDKYDLRNCEIYIPSGTYIHFQGHGINTLFFSNVPQNIFGTDKTTLIGVSTDDAGIPFIDSKLESLNLFNIKPWSGTIMQSRPYEIKNVTLNFKSLSVTSTYVIITEYDSADVLIDGLTVNAPTCYTGVWVERAKNVEIKNCRFNLGSASHGIRINDFTGGCVVDNNFVENCTTGILVATQRTRLLKNIKITRNTVERCTEESVSIDSFGNNVDLVPVIVSSYVWNVNDWTVNGNVVGRMVDLQNLYFVTPSPTGYDNMVVDASFVKDATQYLFLVKSGKLEFTNSLIEKYETINYNGKSTLRLYLKANFDKSMLSNGDEISLLTGAYNCEISGNIVRGAIPPTSQPGHGISLWGGGYYCKIDGNVVDGCKQGLNVAGFGSFGVTNPDYFNYAIGNTVINNTFNNCSTAFEIRNWFGNRFGFANRFNSNNVFGGRFQVDTQKGFMMTQNILVNCSGSVANDGTSIIEGNLLQNSIIK